MNSIELEKQRVAIDNYNAQYYELKKKKDSDQCLRKYVLLLQYIYYSFKFYWLYLFLL